MRRLLLLSIPLLLVLAAPANAATAEVTSEGLRLVDSAGETNSLSVWPQQDGWEIAATAGPLEPGPGCEPPKEVPYATVPVVRCAGAVQPQSSHSVFHLGAGDDTISFLTFAGTTDVYGGAGDDELTFDQNARGRLSGGDGTDRLTAEARVGRFSYRFSLSLDGIANDSPDSKLNIVPDWEVVDAVGRLAGTDRGEILRATDLDGGGGDDILKAVLPRYPPFLPTIVGGAGRDAISYDAPNWLVAPRIYFEATVLARDGEADTIDCTLAPPARLEGDAVDVARGCAPAATYAGPSGPPLRVDKRGYITATIKCEGPSDIPCSGRAVVRTRPAALATPEARPVVFYARGSTGAITPGETKKVRLKVAARWRRAIEQRRKTVIGSLVVETRRATPASSRTSILGDVKLTRALALPRIAR